MALTPFRAGTYVVVARGDDPQGRVAPGLTGYDFVVFGGGDYSVVSVAAGVVVSARVEDGSGSTIKIRNNEGSFDIYSNLRENSFLVRPGDSILAGQAIGIVGTTSLASFTQLRFERRTIENDASSNIQVSFADKASDGLTRRGEAWTSSTVSAGVAAGPLPALPVTTPAGDGRVALPIFDAAYYLASYSDLRSFYGPTNFDGARSHWLQFGIAESRSASLAFDSVYYLSSNPDVAAAFGAQNYAAAITHWLQFGINEGRKGSTGLDPTFYLAVHPDVERSYGARNFSGAISHYYERGRQLGWQPTDPLVSSSVFQLPYYLASYADIAEAFAGPNLDVEATRHWYFSGIEEGRRGSEELDSRFYLAANEDLRVYYGSTNYRGAIEHYLRHGKGEGRLGADDRPRTLSISDATIVEGDLGSKILAFTVSLNIVYQETVTVSYSTANGSATAGSDYSSASGEITFTPGQTTKTIEIQVLGDSVSENDETFSITLSNPTSASLLRSAAVGTISNDDPAVITLAVSPQTLPEDGTTNFVYTFTRAGFNTNALDVSYSVAGSATLGTDYTGIAATPAIKTVTFAAGATTATLSIDPSADSLHELNETVSLSLVPGTGYLVGTTTAVTATIEDNDLPVVSLAVSPASLQENSTNVLLFTFSRDGDTSNSLQIQYSVAGTATLGVDYTGVPATPEIRLLTFAAGAASATVTVDPSSDPLFEQDETVVLSLVNGTGYLIGSSAVATGTILNDDLPVISLAIASESVLEDQANLLFSFSRDGDTSNGLDVYYSLGGTATLGTDYTGIAATPTTKKVSFQPGSATATVTVEPVRDSLFEKDETVLLTLLADSSYSIGTTTAVTGTIVDDDLPVVSLAVSPEQVLEDSGNGLRFTFSRDGDTTAGLSINYSLAGTATLDTDYTGIAATPATKTLAFAPGSATATVLIQPTVEAWFEKNETVTLTVAPGTGYLIGTTEPVTGTILNDDLPVITLSVSPDAVLEDAGNLVYTFSRDGDTTGVLIVNYAVSGTALLGPEYTGIDPTPVTKTVTFAIGESTATVTVAPTVDALFEQDKTVALTLVADPGYLIGTTAAVTGTIGNDDRPVISLAVSAPSQPEDDPNNLVFSFSRDGDTTNGLTVNYSVAGTATLGTDYTGIAPFTGTRTISFAPGSAIATVTIDPTADALFELDETVSLRLEPYVGTGLGYIIGTPNAVVATIANDDLPVISLTISSATTLEDQGTLVYTFSRDGDTSNIKAVSYQVGGSAVLGADYQGIPALLSDRLITFAQGSSTSTITITPIADTAVIDPDTDITITLAPQPDSYLIATPDPVQGRILNDDVESAVSYTMTARDSRLTLTGPNAINGTGNDLNNTIIGNNAATGWRASSALTR